MSEIYDTFKRAFNLIEADTPELKLKVYRLRYQVFCLQYNYLPASNYPDKLERDEYDEYSCHMLIQFVPTGKLIGTTRLILPDPKNLDNPFPIEQHTQIDPSLLKLDRSTRKYTAEISRFLVSPNFDRRKKNRREALKKNRESSASAKAQPSVQPSRYNNDLNDRRKSERRRGDRRSLSIYMVLMAAVVRMSTTHNVKYWLSAMDPAMNRLVGFSGMNIDPIGPVVDYNGLRQPHFGEMDDVICRLYKRNFDAWEVITDRGKYWQGDLPIKKA